MSTFKGKIRVESDAKDSRIGRKNKTKREKEEPRRKREEKNKKKIEP